MMVIRYFSKKELLDAIQNSKPQTVWGNFLEKLERESESSKFPIVLEMIKPHTEPPQLRCIVALDGTDHTIVLDVDMERYRSLRYMEFRISSPE